MTTHPRKVTRLMGCAVVLAALLAFLSAKLWVATFDEPRVFYGALQPKVIFDVGAQRFVTVPFITERPADAFLATNHMSSDLRQLQLLVQCKSWRLLRIEKIVILRTDTVNIYVGREGGGIECLSYIKNGSGKWVGPVPSRR